jgi:hypothetical protein
MRPANETMSKLEHATMLMLANTEIDGQRGKQLSSQGSRCTILLWDRGCDNGHRPLLLERISGACLAGDTETLSGSD